MPNIKTSDIYVCQAFVIVIFLLSDKVFYYVSHVLGYSIMICITAACGILMFSKFVPRNRVTPYLIASSLGTLIFLIKWA